MKPLPTYQSCTISAWNHVLARSERAEGAFPAGRAMPIKDRLPQEQAPEKKNPPVLGADNVYGDGGVDVTGAPKSRSVEGADFGPLSCLSGWQWSFQGRILPEAQASNGKSWGLQFLSRMVFASVNLRLL